ncbi:hypothetical protein ACFL3D_02375 [Candidatus Omnitrophota bacterium]
MAFRRKIIFGIRIAWIFTALVIAANEIFDLPYLILKAAPTPINYTEMSIELILVLIIAFLIELYLQKCLKRIKHLEGFHLICAYCKNVKFNDEWVSIEAFLNKKSDVILSHGMCIKCLKKYFPRVYEKDKGKWDAFESSAAMD